MSWAAAAALRASHRESGPGLPVSSARIRASWPDQDIPSAWATLEETRRPTVARKPIQPRCCGSRWRESNQNWRGVREIDRLRGLRDAGQRALVGPAVVCEKCADSFD